MKKSIGLDIGKGEIAVSIFDGENYRNNTYKNTKGGLKRMVKDFKKEEDCIITMEVTGTYHLRCAYKLYEEGFDVRVENPLVVKRYSELSLRRVKTDKVDARIIATFGYKEDPRVFKPSSKDRMKLKVLVKEIDQVQRDINRNQSRIEALKQYPEKMTESIKRFKNKNKRMKEDVNQIQKEINEIIKCNEKYREINKSLKTIVGVGDRLSGAIIAYMGAYEEFESAKQVASFVGITPTLKQSGKSLYRQGSISKMGNKYLRSLLMMCAKSAVRHNPQCKALNDRLESRGKIYHERLISAGHKLLRQTYGVIKNGKNYDRNYIKDKMILLSA